MGYGRAESPQVLVGEGICGATINQRSAAYTVALLAIMGKRSHQKNAEIILPLEPHNDREFGRFLVTLASKQLPGTNKIKTKQGNRESAIMPEASKTQRQQLDDWEKRLRDYVGEGDMLLGELGLGRQNLEEIGRLFTNTDFQQLRNKRYTIEQTLKAVKAQWPLTYALYLVLEGVYNYDSGDYWDGPSKQLGLQTGYTSRCGRLFLDILADNNLPTFEQSGGHTYVTPILLHGGIPNDLLFGFFDFLWQHEKRPHSITLDAQSLLQLWRKEADDYFGHLPKPVRRFLEYGDLVAEDLVDRCLDLFDTDSPEETETLVDLPKRIIRAYWLWREDKGIQPRSTAPRIRLQKPILTISPYTRGISLYLPPQQFPNRVAPNQLMWRIVADHRPEQIINCHSQRIEGGNQFLAEQLPDISPAQAYQFHLQTNDNALQTWTLPAFGDPPILFFLPYDDYEGDALVDQERFRPGERWLLYPEECVWKTTGSSRKLRDLPRLTGVWRGYKLELWEIAPGEMVLRGGDGREHPFAIIHETIRPRPHFIDGDRLPLPTSAADFPLYIGRPPSIALYTSQPHRWRLLIRAAGASQPSEPRSFKLSQLPTELTENGLCLDLSQSELLGEAPFGKFEIVLRGPLGRSHQLGLRLIPALSVTGLDQLYLDDANRTAEYQFVCDAATTIRQNPPQNGVMLQEVTANEEQRQYRLKARPDIQRLNLQLRHEGVFIPLTIPIRRLRWGLQHGSHDNRPVSWQTEPSAIYPGSLQNAALWVDIPVTKENQLRVGWRLVDGAGEIWRELPPGDQPVHHLQWPLNELTAVWRERRETLCWQLLIQQPEVDEPLIIPAFFLLPTLDFGDLTYQWETSGDLTRLTLLWEHSRPGSYQLQLWPLDRPWIKEALRLSLPETNDTLIEWQLTTKELPAEAYLAELIAYNPWQSGQPQRPQSRTPNSLLIKPPGLSQYYAEITRLRDEGKASVEQLLALLGHEFYNNQKAELHATNKAIADQRENLSLTWLIHWLELARGMGNIVYKLTQIRAFDPAIIDRLAQQSWSDNELDAYFQHMPEQLGEKVYLWVVQSGLSRPRRRCLAALCRLSTDTPERETAVQTAVHAILEDVGDGALLLREAVDLLTPNAQTAANYLAQDGGLDAADLLYELTVRAQLTPNWIAPKMQIETNLGSIRVEKLRQRMSNEVLFCALLDDNCYADGELLIQPTAVPIRLDLRNKQLRFARTEPYQCQHCQQLFTSMADYSQHHQTTHSAQPQARKRLRRDCSISLFAVTLPDNDPATNLEEAAG